MDYILVSLIVCLLLLATVVVHYSVLRRLTRLLNRSVSRPSVIVGIVMVLFLTHSVEIMLYAIFFYFTKHFSFLGSIAGIENVDFFSSVYLSLLSYSSLGFSDLSPLGYLRIIAGFEALNGLVLITWSASFTFLAMGKLWDCDYCQVSDHNKNADDLTA